MVEIEICRIQENGSRKKKSIGTKKAEERNGCVSNLSSKRVFNVIKKNLKFLRNITKRKKIKF